MRAENVVARFKQLGRAARWIAFMTGDLYRREEPATPSFDPAPARPAGDIPGFDIGDKVTHDSYGLGTVIGLEGAGSSAVAKVDFGDGQVKRLLLRYAPVTKL